MMLALLPAGAESATPVTGGNLTVIGLEYSTCFLPFSSSTSDRYNCAPAIEPLGRVDPATGEMQPWLAESFTTDPDALTFTIKLKQGIKFSDGTDFNAAAVVWNFDKMIEYGKNSELGSASSYEATDDYTVVMHFDAWANNWADTIGEVRIYCPAAFDQNGADWAAIHPVGTGAYVLSEFVQDSHMTYVRNDNYWIEGQPYLDSITVMFLKDATTQVSAFLNSEIDVLVSPDVTALSQLNGTYQNIAGASADLAGITYMMFCSGDEKSPFYDVRVREAVMHAIDFEGMAAAIYSGFGFATPLFAVPGSWAYDDTVTQYEYNLDTAKQLLTDAGYPNGFTTTITTNDASTPGQMAAVVVQASMAQIGITAEIKVLTSADFNAQKAEGVYDLGVMINDGSSKKDFVNNYVRLYSTEGVNYKNMMTHPKDYEDALFGARAAKTLDEKKTLLQTASKLLSHDELLVVALGAMSSYAYAQNNVHATGIYTTTAEAWTPEKAWKN
jgi:ABC-type transport system substrate-binding protein